MKLTVGDDPVLSGAKTGAGNKGVARIAISIFDLFTIGIGPSSSHTVGPMRAARAFAMTVIEKGLAPARVSCELYGSLSLTGRGHATDIAVLLGLAGETPEDVDPEQVGAIVADIRAKRMLMFGGCQRLGFNEAQDLIFRDAFLPEHPNAMVFTAVLDDGYCIVERYYSVGGGAVRMGGDTRAHNVVALRLPFSSGAELLAIGKACDLSIAAIVRANETA